MATVIVTVLAALGVLLGAFSAFFSALVLAGA